MSDKASEMSGGRGVGESKRYSKEGGREEERRYDGGKMQMWRCWRRNMMLRREGLECERSDKCRQMCRESEASTT